MDDFNEAFFDRLSKSLKESGITASELSSRMGKSPRYLEVCKRNKTLPDLQMLIGICRELNKDIRYFTGQISENNQMEDAEIAFPSSYATFSEILTKTEFSNYLKSISFPDCKLKLTFYFTGIKTNEILYVDFVLKELYEKIAAFVKKTGEDEALFAGLDIKLYLPSRYTVDEILSDNFDINDIYFDEKTNVMLNEFYDEFSLKIRLFREKLFHLCSVKFISKIKFELHKVSLCFEQLRNAESAFIANDFSVFTNKGNNLITHEANRNSALGRIVSDYIKNEILTSDKTKKITKVQKEDFIEYFEKWKNGEFPVEQLESFFKQPQNIKVVQFLLSKTVLIGLPGVGKSTVMQRIKELFFENISIEMSDEYINYRVFDDNCVFVTDGSDSRESFKKKSNNKFYLEIRENTVLSTICKAVGKSALIDIGAKEICYDSVLFKLLDEDYTIVHLVYSEQDNRDDENFYLRKYIDYIFSHYDEIIDKEKRHNLYKAYKEKGKEGFKSFIRNLFLKRFPQYEKRSHCVVHRLPEDGTDAVVLKVLYSIFLKSL